MVAFLVSYFVVYGSANAYLCWRVCAALRPPAVVAALAWFAVLCLVTGPIAVRLLERGGHVPAARLLAFVVFSWMAVVVWFLFIGGAVDLWRIGARTLQALHPGARAAVPDPRAAMIGIGTAIAALSVVSFVNARRLDVRTISLTTPRLPAGSPPLRIAQVADLHLGLTVGRREADRSVALLRQLAPDVVVCTGDLVDASADQLTPMASGFASLAPPLGKYAVLGNHEYYAGLNESLAFLRAAGFRVLRGEIAEASPEVRIAGVDDAVTDARDAPSPPAQEDTVLPEEQNRPFTVLLKHRPTTDPAAAGRFDLQLSGHTHGGQIFPFHVFVRCLYPRYRGLHALPQGSHLYVSCGTGSWGPPMRLLARREITLFVVEPENSTPSGVHH